MRINNIKLKGGCGAPRPAPIWTKDGRAAGQGGALEWDRIGIEPSLLNIIMIMGSVATAKTLPVVGLYIVV